MLKLIEDRYQRMSVGMTTGSDSPTNISAVSKKVPMSLIQSLNSSIRSTFQKRCFRIR